MVAGDIWSSIYDDGSGELFEGEWNGIINESSDVNGSGWIIGRKD